jgi:glyoxylase-like metal-dependent hydrolase (beta-lactamase superfamily II)
MLHRDIAEGVHRIEHAYTNFYLVEDGADVTIFDAGFPRSYALLQNALTQLGRSLSDVGAIVLTHAHPDHIGFAERARTELGVSLWLHEREVSVSRHPFRYETESSVARYIKPSLLKVAGALVAAGALATKPLGEVRAYAGEPELDVPGRPVPICTPGHTHGHASFHLPDRGVVIAGDALVTHNPYTGGRGPQIVSAPANVDSTEAIASLTRIAETRAQIVLTGHGEPWTAGAVEAVEHARAVGPS